MDASSSFYLLILISFFLILLPIYKNLVVPDACHRECYFLHILEPTEPLFVNVSSTSSFFSSHLHREIHSFVCGDFSQQSVAHCWISAGIPDNQRQFWASSHTDQFTWPTNTPYSLSRDREKMRISGYAHRRVRN